MPLPPLRATGATPCAGDASAQDRAQSARRPDPVRLRLLALGAVVMRGAGCTLNDIADREYDGKVARTRLRPLPSGRVTVPQAVVFMIAQLAIGAAILVSLNHACWWLGV